MAQKDESYFENALSGKKIPILTLDNSWHRLFSQNEPSSEIVRLENEVNELLKKQGMLNTKNKDLQALKKRLMGEIMQQMEELSGNPSSKTEKKLAENKRLIEECNQKIEEIQNDIYDLPKLIDKANYKLMLQTMEECYRNIQENNDEIEDISKWIEDIRVELKKKVVRKQQKIIRNQNYYTYMHNIFGSEVIDIFDMKYNVVPISSEAIKPSAESNIVIKEDDDNS